MNDLSETVLNACKRLEQVLEGDPDSIKDLMFLLNTILILCNTVNLLNKENANNTNQTGNSEIR
jgi:hypothetical protein